MRLFALRWLILSAAAGCVDTADDAELEWGKRFVEDATARRAALESSLAVSDNGYAELRLNHYAVADTGWDALPVFDPPVRPVGLDQPPAPVGTESAWTRQALLQLGERAFRSYPAQRQPALSRLLAEPTLLERVGLQHDREGRLLGVVLASYPDGSEQPALSCEACHSRLNEAGVAQHGPASDFDLGALLNAGAGESDWGPGRVDVTPDDADNPVAIPDLRATRHQRWLHWSGNLRNDLPSLTVRIETLLVTSSNQVVRPPRQLALALALYVRSLGERPAPPAAPSPEGSRIFDAQCRSCHAGPTGEGQRIAVQEVGTDPGAADSSTRGTGAYRTPSLFRVAERTRLTHDGRYESLAAMFDPSRAADSEGHPYGLDLSPSALPAPNLFGTVVRR